MTVNQNLDNIITIPPFGPVDVAWLLPNDICMNILIPLVASIQYINIYKEVSC